MILKYCLLSLSFLKITLFQFNKVQFSICISEYKIQGKNNSQCDPYSRTLRQYPKFNKRTCTLYRTQQQPSRNQPFTFFGQQFPSQPLQQQQQQQQRPQRPPQQQQQQQQPSNTFSVFGGGGAPAPSNPPPTNQRGVNTAVVHDPDTQSTSFFSFNSNSFPQQRAQQQQQQRPEQPRSINFPSSPFQV